MNRKIVPIIFLCLLISMLISAAVSADINTDLPIGINNTFGKNSETERNFTWITSATTKSGFIEYCPKVDFKGFTGHNIIKVAAHSFQSKTDLDIRVIHKVELKNLKPGTEYIYRLGTSGMYGTQGVFKTAEQNLNSFTFLTITDTQGASTGDYRKWKNTLDSALAKFTNARFLVHTGDIVDNGQKISQWDAFAVVASDRLINLPIVPAIGNHDMLNGNGTNTDAKNFTDRFDLPIEKDTGAPAGTVYSFDYGNAHIAIMNTQCGSKYYAKQGEWLRNDMKLSKKVWKIVALHRGPYGATYDTTDIRKAWTPIFDELGIDLVLQGHDHNYVRSYPIKNGEILKSGKGTIYLVSNTGGVKFYPQKIRSWQEVDLQPKMQMYIAVTVNKTKMYIKAYDNTNSLKDFAILEK